MKRSKRILLIAATVCLAAMLSTGFYRYAVYTYSIAHYEDDLTNGDTIQDVGRLLPTKISRIERGKEETQLSDLVTEANKQGVPLSIAGKRHSQGGHTYYRDGISIDMTGYNKILSVNPEAKTIHVQSGATWDSIQQALNPHGLAVKVMQSQNIFTVGGSMSVNVHGRDIQHDALGSTINWFRLLKADGTIVKVDKQTQPELFYHVIGGYGLFGIILDVELQVTDDVLYKIQTKTVPISEYSAYVHSLKKNPAVKMAYARVSVAPKTQFQDLYVIEYHAANKNEDSPDLHVLKEDEFSWISYEFLNLSRKTAFGKNLLWSAQKQYSQSIDGKVITRNNVMRSETNFLLYKNARTTDVLQEFFVPVDSFSGYMQDMNQFMQRSDLNLLNYTIRYVSKDTAPALAYAKSDMLAFVALMNHGKKPEEVARAQKSIQGLIDITLDHDGTFYLPYYPYASNQQLLRAYPDFPAFVQTKQAHDPSGLFTNEFYEAYRSAAP